MVLFFNALIRDIHQTYDMLNLIPGMLQVALSFCLMGAIIVPLERFIPAHPENKKTWQTTILDLIYWFFTPIVTRAFTVAALAVMLPLALRIVGRPITTDILHGFGALGSQPIWLQAIEILLIIDFVDYWTHRFLHSSRFWRIHAVHHSAKQMDWISSSRMHPLNDLITRSCQLIPLVIFGFAPSAIIGIVPFLSFYVVFLHSNIRWDFGPLRYVLVSPCYHHWHHSSDDEALDRNFAGFFPIWDILFDTIYFPRHYPKQYGLKSHQPAESFIAHMKYPFTAEH